MRVLAGTQAVPPAFDQLTTNALCAKRTYIRDGAPKLEVAVNANALLHRSATISYLLTNSLASSSHIRT